MPGADVRRAAVSMLCRAVHRRPRVQPVGAGRTQGARGPAPCRDRFFRLSAGQGPHRRSVGQVEEASFEYVNTPRSFDFPGTDCDLLEQLGTLAGDCWQLFALGGYARVDFRVDTAGKPWILEINANPCLSPDAGFAAALAQASIPWETRRRAYSRRRGVSQTLNPRHRSHTPRVPNPPNPRRRSACQPSGHPTKSRKSSGLVSPPYVRRISTSWPTSSATPSSSDSVRSCLWPSDPAACWDSRF